MSRCLTSLLGLLIALSLSLSASASEVKHYSVGDLLRPCQEGDNDARWGANLEAECEQFINGFTDAYLLLTGGGEDQSICLPPPGNRSDEMRWAFTEWAYDHYGQRDMPAAAGLLEAIKAHFPCE